jgi:hypothetical protein
LIEAKALVGHGSERTARHYMGISELAKTANFADLEPLDISSLYLLAAPSTPECARDEVAERVRGGERPAYNEIRHIVQATKSTPLCLPLAPIIGESRPFVQAVFRPFANWHEGAVNIEDVSGLYPRK